MSAASQRHFDNNLQTNMIRIV